MPINSMMTFHFRIGHGKNTQPKAGATVVFLPEKRKFGIALCSRKDRYSRKIGRQIAIGRARSLENKTKRFNSTPFYEGPMEKKNIRKKALEITMIAAKILKNPLYDVLPLCMEKI